MPCHSLAHLPPQTKICSIASVHMYVPTYAYTHRPVISTLHQYPILMNHIKGKQLSFALLLREAIHCFPKSRAALLPPKCYRAVGWFGIPVLIINGNTYGEPSVLPSLTLSYDSRFTLCSLSSLQPSNLHQCLYLSIQDKLSTCEKRNRDMLAENEKQVQVMNSNLKTAEEESKACASESDSSHQFQNCHKLQLGMPST